MKKYKKNHRSKFILTKRSDKMQCIRNSYKNQSCVGSSRSMRNYFKMSEEQTNKRTIRRDVVEIFLIQGNYTIYILYKLRLRYEKNKKRI